MKRRVLLVIPVALIVILALVWFIFNSNVKDYGDYTGESQDSTEVPSDEEYSDNLLLNNENVIEESISIHTDELKAAGVTDVKEYEVSYSANKTLVTVVYTLPDKTVYMDIKYNEDLSEEVYYMIFDDQSAD